MFLDSFWESLKPESAFLARSAATYLRDTLAESKLEELLPVATALAFRIEHVYEKLKDEIKADPPSMEVDEKSTPFETTIFVLDQLLRLAMFLDFTDEAGRRKMFAFIRS